MLGHRSRPRDQNREDLAGRAAQGRSQPERSGGGQSGWGDCKWRSEKCDTFKVAGVEMQE